MSGKKAIRIGVGGPVGSGKTMCVLRLCEWLKGEYSMAVITHDIYTREDAEFLLRAGVLPADQTPSLPVPDPANNATREKQIPFRNSVRGRLMVRWNPAGGRAFE